MNYEALIKHNQEVDKLEIIQRHLYSDNLMKHPTEEYLEMLEPFQEVNNRLLNMLHSSSVDYVHRIEEAKSKVVRWEYARGGMSVERGFYHPCPVHDLTTGGANRGRLLKNLKRAKEPDYTYGFDADDKMVYVRQFHDSRCIDEAWITYDENRTFTVYAKSVGGVYEKPRYAVECVYENGRIVWMASIYATFYIVEHSHIEIYEYFYSERGIHRKTSVSFFPELNFIKFDSYDFGHDEEGYLTEYWDSFSTRENPHRIEPLKRRKV